MSSKRIIRTPPAIIDELIEKHASVVKYNLAPGSPNTLPNKKAIEKVMSLLCNDGTVRNLSKYNDVIGKHNLRQAWVRYIYQNDAAMDELIPEHELMVTAGANQAFYNLVVTICDAHDHVIVIKPYYFSHVNALLMNDVDITYVSVDERTLLPDANDVSELITNRTRMVLVCNPGNPSGVTLSNETLDDLSSICARRQVYLCLDEAYREYDFSNTTKGVQTCYSPPLHRYIVKIYTMSKVFGMAGWRIGAVLYPKSLSGDMQKVQDTIATHASTFSQTLAYEALHYPPYHHRVALRVRDVFVRNVKPVYDQVADMSHLFIVPSGAFYMFLPYRLPNTKLKALSDEECSDECKHEDEQAVSDLSVQHGVLTTPGWIFGMSGRIRVCFGAVAEQDAEDASHRLAAGLLGILLKKTSR